MTKDNQVKVRNPQFCYLTVTERCLFRCKTCYAWRKEKNLNEATVNEWKDFLDSLKGLTDAAMEVHISGGEPLLKEGILELVDFGVKKGFNVSMATNAYLVNEELAGKIVNSGLRTVVISLNSLDEDIHDFLKGIKGSYRKTMDAIQYLIKLKSNLQICICVLIAEQTLGGLIKLTEWVCQQDRLSAVSFQAITQPFHTLSQKEWYRKGEYSFLWPRNIAKVYSILEELIRLKENGARIGNSIGKLRRYQSYFQDPQSMVGVKCNVGDCTVTLLPNGDISLCRYGSIGNIREDDIREIWLSKRANRVREKMKTCKRNCEHLINGNYEDS